MSTSKKTARNALKPKKELLSGKTSGPWGRALPALRREMDVIINGARSAYGRLSLLKHIEERSAIACAYVKVCVKSFLNGTLTRVNIVRRKWTLASAGMCAALLLSVTIVNSTAGVSVYVNGQSVGATRNIAEVPKIVASAEERLTKILGHDYSLNDSLSLAMSANPKETKTDELENAIISSVDGVEEKYVLLVEGEVVGAADEEEALTGVLDDVLNEYTTEATSEVGFLEEVEIDRQFVSEDVVQDPVTIKTLIEPDNEDSSHSVAVENVEAVLYSEVIPYKTEYIEDDTVYEGESIVVSSGEDGIIQVTEKLVMVNGVELSRDKMGELIVKKPVTEVIAIGTAPRPATASTGSYIWPAQGTITSTYGYRSTSVGSTNHRGLDIAGRSGQSIYAADGGEVIYSGWKNAYGNVIIIRHDNGEETVYGHNSKLLVSVGELVAQGQEIALMGSTGLSTGVHCHFEIRIGGEPVDPQKFLA